MKIIRAILFVAVGLVVSAGQAVAQTETGRISGTVTDPQGGVIPGVTVTATSVGTGALRTTVTDASGHFVIANVLASVYDVKFELSGFKTTTTRLTVSVGREVSADAKLEVGGLSETVSVTAGAETINVRSSEVATTINEAQIRELPTLTRNVYDLVGLAGNVADTPVDGTARGTGFNINGMRSASTNVLLDGAANNDEFAAGVGQNVPLDSVQEFSVISNNFSAQYGRASGGIVNVITKAGTNAFRGTAYDFYRSDKIANNTVQNVANKIEKGKFNRNQTGYSLGGPIKRDKIQFFSSLEYIRVRSADTQISWVPTPQFLAATSAATQNFFNTYGKGVTINGPTLTRAQVSGIVGAGAGAFNSLPADLPVFGRVDKSLARDAGGGDPQDHYQFVGRVDLSPSQSTQVYVRYAYQNQQTEPGTNVSSPYSGFDTGFVNKNDNILGSVTHVFSSNFTTQTKMVYNRLFNDQPLNGPNQPTLFMNPSGPVRLQGYRITFPGYGPWSPGNAIPFGGPQKLTQLYQDQTLLKGNHDFRFGGSFVHIADDRTFGAYANSVEALNTGSNSLVSLNNLVLGQILRFQTAINPKGYPGGSFVTPVQLPSFTSFNKYNEFGLYAADNWSISNRLKLNLGLRYEYYGPQQKSQPKYDSNFYYGDPNVSVNTSTPTQIIDAVRSGAPLPSNESPIGNLWKPDWNNFAPRVGFAWDVNGDGKTSLRGGYGIGYERNFGNVTFNVLFNPPQYLVASIDAPADVPSQPIYTDISGPFGGVAGVRKTIPAGSLRHVDQNIETAFSHFYGLSMQKELGSGVTASVEYNGSSGRKLYDLADINKRGAALIYEGIGTASQRSNTRFGAFNTRGNRGQSQYHGLTLSLDSRKIGNTGLQLTGRYTVSQAKDNLSNTFSDGNNGNYNLGYLDAFNPMLDYGYAEFDVRNRLSLAGIWELPFLRDGAGVKRTVLGGWALNWNFTARSGYPFSVFDCENEQFANCMRVLDTAGINKNVTSGVATGNPNEYTLIDLKPILGTIGSYTNPKTGNSDWGPYPATMTARDAFRGPGAWYFDFILGKRFRFGEHQAAQIRFEAYNLFNHANMFVHTDDADASSTSAITGYKDGNRRLQLGFKFEF